MSEVRDYMVKRPVVKAMRFDGDFDLEFLEDNENVRLSCNGTSILINDALTGRSIAFVDPGMWMVRIGDAIEVMDDEEFQHTFEAQS